MSKRCKYTAEERYEIIKAYKDGVGQQEKLSLDTKLVDLHFTTGDP